MNDVSASFPTTSRNRVKRLHERGSYDHAAVFAVLDAGLLCHVAYTFDGQPYCTPTIHWREGDMLYWHGSSASRMLRQLRGGRPACLTVSHLDGLVLARTGFNHSANYRSAMCFGTARIVDEPEEKKKALAKATMVIGMRIEEASAKVRAKGVADDEEDYGHPVWAGVIPVRMVIGAAEPCPRQMPGIERPGNLAGYAEGERLDRALMQAQAVYEGEIS
ncbi:pyridoxamine 5'-phosphate oxidase family protein [Mesorhizobium loti]|nr:pyridoxamine 5'-phosphate oxidase family protein [Mesorhizobium japonicum]PBB13551.1 pyridoxamine 5'-phosphate oxidase family protein [Mesorhizobium loti]QGX81211.1 pyridoxamine 5'-phosphate oxidase family protein [Mesorhizobium japonicum R7A]MUT29584.1 pyridoxamine 5'-phosphate oxidase family protein [Mesorhizobium japonicum]PBB49812.1 pyridoxamine 5'-phosphate oxidase family protein [Mesorhizobium loti]